jgi:hypothetical protein
MSKVDFSILVTATIFECGLTCGTPPRTLLIKFSTSSLGKMHHLFSICKFHPFDIFPKLLVLNLIRSVLGGVPQVSPHSNMVAVTKIEKSTLFQPSLV